MEHTCAACGKAFYTDIQFCDDCEGETMNADDLLGCYRRQIERLEALLEIRERRIAELEAEVKRLKMQNTALGAC